MKGENMSCMFKKECPSYGGWCEGPKQDFSKCVQFLISAYNGKNRRLRPCMINLSGTKCYFHKWVLDNETGIHFNTLTRPSKMLEIKAAFDEHGVLPASCTPIDRTRVMALIEFEDGTMTFVRPVQLTFLDRPEVTGEGKGEHNGME